jgi:putative AlgH/UPF0301 family transcriptional regulator
MQGKARRQGKEKGPSLRTDDSNQFPSKANNSSCIAVGSAEWMDGQMTPRDWLDLDAKPPLLVWEGARVHDWCVDVSREGMYVCSIYR